MDFNRIHFKIWVLLSILSGGPRIKSLINTVLMDLKLELIKYI